MQIATPDPERIPGTVSLKLLPVLLAAVLMVGCSGGIRPEAPAADDRLQLQAVTLEAAGNYQGAAELYLQAATTAVPPEQYHLNLQAAAILIRGGDLLRAASLLDAIPKTALDATDAQLYDLNRAAIAVAEQHPDIALALLVTVPSSGPHIAGYHRVRAAAYVQKSEYIFSVRERVLLGNSLQDPDAQLENDTQLWETLNNLTDAELQQYRSAPPPDTLSGWLELMELTRLYLQQPDALAEIIPQWQQRYPGHPASRAFTARLLDTMRQAGRPPASIALLLPLNGKLASAASAVRDGILAAYYDTPATGTQPQLHIYDSGDSPETALASYQQAVTAGAEFVIGPLRKEAVEAVLGQPVLPVPVLALNQIETPLPDTTGRFQFGLAPEDEAREAARRAWREGYTRSIALLPDTDWGERVYAAFATEWQTLGGVILETQHYENAKTDHSKVISAALNLDNSIARHKQLSAHLGRKLGFEPRRRQDLDIVFLVASPGQARLIRPQLSFFRATNVPVYATSQVYGGTPNASVDADMDGITFCDMPWVLDSGNNWKHLQEGINEYWGPNVSRYARLYALGIDAWRIVPYLGELGGSMFGAYHGVSGNLTLDSQGVVNRSLRCARFSNGIPVLLEAGKETADATVPAAF
jgi:outer membrane PBP1 activator LpoA protein